MSYWALRILITSHSQGESRYPKSPIINSVSGLAIIFEPATFKYRNYQAVPLSDEVLLYKNTFCRPVNRDSTTKPYINCMLTEHHPNINLMLELYWQKTEKS